jgi:hypothetical protein
MSLATPTAGGRTQTASLLPRGRPLSSLFGDYLMRREPIYAALGMVWFRRRATKASADAFASAQLDAVLSFRLANCFERSVERVLLGSGGLPVELP